MVGGVAGRGKQTHPSDDLHLAFYKLDLAGVFKGLEVLGEVGGAGALVGAGGDLPLALRDEVAGAGEGGDRLAIGDQGVAAGVIEVEVCIDDDVHVLGPDAFALQVTEQRPALVRARNAGGAACLGADAGLHEHGLPLTTDEHGVQAQGEAVLVVQLRQVALPHQAGGEAEDGAGVLAQDAIAHHEQLEIAQPQPLTHGTARLPPICLPGGQAHDSARPIASQRDGARTAQGSRR